MVLASVYGGRFGTMDAFTPETIVHGSRVDVDDQVSMYEVVRTGNPDSPRLVRRNMNISMSALLRTNRLLSAGHSAVDG